MLFSDGSDRVNSFETDLFRAVASRRFGIAVLLQLAVLLSEGMGSTLYQMGVPLICTLPYAGGWLDEYRQGFVKYALSRSTVRGYILGKIFACGLAGGLAELLGVWIYALITLLRGEAVPDCDCLLLFLCAMLWATTAATLAALSDSKYIAYGGSFVICYFLVILCERYWKGLYCLYPYEWLSPAHVWVFDRAGTVLLLCGLLTVICMAYFAVIKRRLARV